MKPLLVAALVFISTSCFAQYPYDAKRDNLWPFGYGYAAGFNDTLFGLTWLDYASGSLNINREFIDIDFRETDAVGCDTNGNLLFTTNGIMIYNRNSTVMQGCDTLNPGHWAEQTAAVGYILPQGALALPMLANNTEWCLFHSRLRDSHNNLGGYDVEGVYYSLIDVKQNFGLGAVTSLRNPLALNDTIDYGKLTGCRHANGRDWWIVFFNSALTKYKRLLLSPFGVQDLGWHQFPNPSLPYLGLGQAVFTPDGTKYLNFGVVGNVYGEFLEIYDFDRCNGKLSTPNIINVFDSCIMGGVAVSPNSRFAYTSCGDRVYQYDLEAADVEASKQLVAQWDGFVDPEFPVGTFFYLMGGTPDDKIIINSSNTVRFIHTIDQPDSPGLACNVLQHNIALPTFNGASMPNYPNFRLGPVDGSACDTLGIDVGLAEPPKQATNVQPALEVYPNPAGNYCNIGFGSTLKQDGILIVHDLNGRTMFETPLQKATIGYTLKTEGWPATMYLCTVYEGSKAKGSIRFVKE